MQVPLLSQPDRSYVLVVTARHIIQPRWALCPTENPRALYVRLNKKNFAPTDADGTGFVLLNAVLDNQQSAWLFPDDPQVDVAVTILDPHKFSDYELVGLPISEFAAPDELSNLYEGSEIVSAGLVPGASGKRRNYPFFKFGRISTISDEPMDVGCAPNGRTQARKVWLLDANLIPGNSGSPIFSLPPGGNGVSFGGRPILLGLQSTSILGADVAGMTPSNYILDVIKKLNLQDADLYVGRPESKPKPADKAQKDKS